MTPIFARTTPVPRPHRAPRAAARILRIAAAAPLAAAPLPLLGQSWDGDTGTLWSTATNWDSNAVPAAGGNVFIDAGALANQPRLDVNSAALSSVSITSGTLTVDALLSAATVGISGTGNLVVNPGDGIVGAITKGGTGALTHNGTITGSLVLTGGVYSNGGAVTGPVTVSGGTLHINAGSGFSDSAAFTVNGGQVYVNAADVVGALSGGGGTIQFANNVALTSSVAGSVSWFGNMIGSIGTTNAVYFQKAGSGTLTLSGVSAVNGPGRVLVSAGTLVAAGGSAIANGTMVEVANGARFELAASETIGALRGGGTGSVALGGNTLTLAGLAPDLSGTAASIVIAGTGGLTVNAPGFTQTLSGVQTYTGPTTVTAGTLRLGANNVIADASSLLVNGGTFDLGSNDETVAGVSLQGGSITGTGLLRATSTFDVRAGSVSARLVGAVGLSKSGAGSVNLTGVNGYSGPTTISAGLLDVSGGGSLASTSIAISGGIFRIAPGALAALPTVSIGGTGELGVTGTHNLAALAQSGGTTNPGPGTVLNVAGAFTQSGGTAGGTLDINAASFAQSGGATIAAGTSVTANGSQTLQGGTIAGVLDGTGPVTVSGGTTAVSGRIDSTNLTISGGGLLRAGGASLAGAATLRITDGRWDMTAPTILERVQIDAAGTLDFGAFAGTYEPLLVSRFHGGGRIALNTFLGDGGSPTDTLVIATGEVTGTTTLHVRNTGGPGAPTTGDGILLIEVNGLSPADAFVLAAPGHVTAGDYRYTLGKSGNHWFLRSQLVPLFADGFE